jgi:hypothetical protein
MTEITREELRRLAREKFGRELTDAEAELIASRLPALAQVANRLLQWQSQLGDIEPATTYNVPTEARRDR